MSLFLKIKDLQLNARREKNGVEASLFTTLIGEATTAAKKARPSGEPTDQEMIALIKKFISNLDDLLGHSPGNFNAILEKSVLVRLLPKQMTESEIRQILNQQGFNYKDRSVVGIVMQYFKQNFEGLYDSRLVTSIIKEYQNAQ